MSTLKNCRTCLEGIEEHMPKYSILKNDNIRKMLVSCADIHVEVSPHYPETICLTCYKDLTLAYRFKCRAEMCEEKYFSEIKDPQLIPMIVWKNGEKSKINKSQINPDNELATPFEFVTPESSDSVHPKNELKTPFEFVTPESAYLVVEADKIRSRGYKCDRCDEIFPTKHLWNRHRPTHLKRIVDLCWICGKFYKGSYHESVHKKNKPFIECTLCQKVFRTKPSYLTHYKRHISSEKTHLCSICGKSFFTAENLKVHTRTHTKEKPFVCKVEDCGKSFTTQSHLCNHMKRHNDIRPHECSVCHKRFYDTVLLRNHQAIHSDEKPHACELCEFRTKHVSAVWTHMKLVHGKEKKTCDKK